MKVSYFQSKNRTCLQ